MDSIKEMYPNVTINLQKFRKNFENGKKAPITYIRYSGRAEETPFFEVWRYNQDDFVVILDSASSVPGDHNRNVYNLRAMHTKEGYIANLVSSEPDELLAYMEEGKYGSKLCINFEGEDVWSAPLSGMTELQLKSWLSTNVVQIPKRRFYLGEEITSKMADSIATKLMEKFRTQKTMKPQSILNFV